MDDFRVSVSDVGDWDGNEGEAAAAWNAFVAPALCRLRARVSSIECEGEVQGQAWTRFCSPKCGEGWSALGLRVAAYVESQDGDD